MNKERLTAALHGASALMPAIAYFVLRRRGDRASDTDAPSRDVKGKISFARIGLAFVNHWLASLWLVPDRRDERASPGEQRTIHLGQGRAGGR